MSSGPSKPTRRNTGVHSGEGSPILPARQEDDEGLVMRDRAEREEGSIGKAGAVERGVTKPKRRLSSRPLAHVPFYPDNRGQSSAPPSPNGSAIASARSGSQSAFHYASNSAPSPTYKAPAPIRLNDSDTDPASKDGVPTFCGVELKWISLITLALQNAFLTIIMHYSRISTAPNRTYSAAAAVLLNELLKGAISVIIALKKIDAKLTNTQAWNEKGLRVTSQPSTSRLPSYLHASRLKNLSQQVFSPDCYKLAVPAILYVIQNNLQYVAASNLDVATFQVTYQMKILTTAFFSVLLLRKRLSRTKWLALVLLAVGVGIVQLQSTAAPAHVPGTASAGEKPLAARTESAELLAPRVMHPLRGFIAVVLACMTSGLAGVYFEFILKSSSGSSPPPDLWVRNTQLSAFSLIPALVPILFGGSGQVDMGWFAGVANKFRNFNGWAIGTVLTQTLGGLITAIVIKYSDNIMKGFATSLSIIISFLASVALFSYPITLSFIVGATIVLAATYIYNSPGAPAAPASRTNIAVSPGSPIHASAPILGEPEKPSRASSVINLLGLGSNPSSRQPSTTDLRNAAGLGYGSSQHVYAASAPGSPFLSNPYALHRSNSPQLGKQQDGAGKPPLSVNTRGQN